MPFDHEHSQSVRQFVFHHTIRQPERGRMRQVDAKAKVQAKDYTENQKTPTIFFTVFTQPQP
jgi:hypothetical protein